MRYKINELHINPSEMKKTEEKKSPKSEIVLDIDDFIFNNECYEVYIKAPPAL